MEATRSGNAKTSRWQCRCVAVHYLFLECQIVVTEHHPEELGPPTAVPVAKLDDRSHLMGATMRLSVFRATQGASSNEQVLLRDPNKSHPTLYRDMLARCEEQVGVARKGFSTFRLLLLMVK